MAIKTYKWSVRLKNSKTGKWTSSKEYNSFKDLAIAIGSYLDDHPETPVTINKRPSWV